MNICNFIYQRKSVNTDYGYNRNDRCKEPVGINGVYCDNKNGGHGHYYQMKKSAKTSAISSISEMDRLHLVAKARERKRDFKTFMDTAIKSETEVQPASLVEISSTVNEGTAPPKIVENDAIDPHVEGLWMQD